MKQTLFIDNVNDEVLPNEYHKINNICAVIYDQITEIFSEENYTSLFETKLKFNKHNQSLEQLENGEIHILDFLKENDLNDEIENILTKHLLLAISNDFVNFVFESLSCAKKCKATVAYALSRKPFTDELLLLEQLSVDRKKFINNFFHIGDSKTYDPSYNFKKKDIIKETIEKTINKLNMNYFLSKDFIYELRYDKSFVPGINGTSNMALHIVTTDKNYKTTEQNLNFIFSKKEDIFEQLSNYYSTIPHLLFYAASVIDEIAFSFLKKNDHQNKSIKILKQFKRLIGHILFSEANKTTTPSKNNKLFKTISESLNFRCENCNSINAIRREDFEQFFYYSIITCNTCSNNILDFDKNIDEIEKLSR